MRKIRLALARFLFNFVRILVKYQYHIMTFADLLDNGVADGSIKEEAENGNEKKSA